ncbi:MAG: prolyl oligopeptidase family serine peptidase [Bacteroidales bacterium]
MLGRQVQFIDINKVGIYGHSGGGSAFTAATGHADFYDVAVSSSGNYDNNIYNLWWGDSSRCNGG